MGSRKKCKYVVGGDGRKVTILNKAEELCILCSNRVFAGVVGTCGDTQSWPQVGYEPIIQSFRFRRDIEAYLQSKVPPKPPKSYSKPITRFDPVPFNVLRTCESELLLRIQYADSQIDALIESPPHTDAAVDDILIRSIYDEFEALIKGPPLAAAPSCPSLESTSSACPVDSNSMDDSLVRILYDFPPLEPPSSPSLDSTLSASLVDDNPHYAAMIDELIESPPHTDAAVDDSLIRSIYDKFEALIKGPPLAAAAASSPSLESTSSACPVDSNSMDDSLVRILYDGPPLAPPSSPSLDSTLSASPVDGNPHYAAMIDELIESPPSHPSPTHDAVDDNLVRNLFGELEAPLAAASSPSLDCPLFASLVDVNSPYAEYMAALDAHAFDNGISASEASSEFDYVYGWCF